MKLEYIVQEDDENIKQILKLKFNMSDRFIVKLKHNNCIFINGKNIHIWNKIEKGDILSVEENFQEETPNIVPNNNINIDILFEDDYLIIVNKPAGIPVHPSASHYNDSLSNGIKAYYEKTNLKKLIRPVNRLDKNTSGIVIFAKNEYVQDCLIKQMRTKDFKKYYIAVLEGLVEEDEGKINIGISRKEGSVIERKIDKDGAEAVSLYKVLKRLKNKKLSVVEYTLETGRTHQLRLHSKYIGHPIIGDSLYNKETNLINRQALHAYKTQFCHPITRKIVTIESKLPKDIKELIEQ